MVKGILDIDFTFSIVNWNTKDLLDRCLASIEREKGNYAVQTLVADNKSADGSAEMVRTKHGEVTLIENEWNCGFAKGHDPLFRLSKGRYHVLVNSDVALLPGCLAVIEKRLMDDSRIGVLGCQIIGADGEIQPSCRRFPSLLFQLVEAAGFNRFLPKHRLLNAYKMGDFDHCSSREVDQVMGSFFVIRHELIEKIGGLDTDYFMYYEEVDYCLRAREAGYTVFFEAGGRVLHEGGASANKVKVLTIRRTMRSMRHYFEKHLGKWSWLPLLLIVSLDTVTHFLYALLRWDRPMQTLKAYGLGWWDVLCFRKADT